MKIIKEELKEFWLVYEDAHGNGYSFPCDEMGNINISSPAARMNLAVAKAHPDKWSKNGEVVARIKHNRYGVCPYCGHMVSLCGEGYFGAFSCECGRWYNRFGQELVSPEHWYDGRDEDWYEELYDTRKDESYKYWYEGWYED